jgi:hypothetical protein
MADDVSADLESMSGDERAAQIDAQLFRSPEEVAAQTPQPTAEEVAAATQAEAEKIIAEEEVKAVTEGKPPARIRIDALPDADRSRIAAATTLAKGEGISFGEAWGRITGNPAAFATPETTTVETTPAVDNNDPLAAQRAELATLTAELDEELESEPLYGKELADKVNRRHRLELEITLAERERAIAQAQLEQSEEQAFATAFQSNLDAAHADFPDAADATTPLGMVVEAAVAKEMADPNSEYQGNAAAAKLIIEKMAAKMGIKPKVSTVPAQATQQTTPAQQPFRPFPGSAGSLPSVQPNAAAEHASYAKSLAEASTPEEKAALIDRRLGYAGDSAGITMMA